MYFDEVGFMRAIVDEFMKTTKIPETPNGTVRAIMEFITEPESIEAMILMSEMGQPALSGIVKKLEEQFAFSDFPLHRDARDKNAPNRRNIGWMVKYVMREFGYTPTGEEPLQSRIGRYSGSKYFGYSAIYHKTIDSPKYRVSVIIEVN